MLAGAARMSPPVFIALNVGGTAARLAAIRGAVSLFPAQLAWLLGLVEAHKHMLIVIMTLIVAVGSWQMSQQQQQSSR